MAKEFTEKTLALPCEGKRCAVFGTVEGEIGSPDICDENGAFRTLIQSFLHTQTTCSDAPKR